MPPLNVQLKITSIHIVLHLLFDVESNSIFDSNNNLHISIQITKKSPQLKLVTNPFHWFDLKRDLPDFWWCKWARWRAE